MKLENQMVSYCASSDSISLGSGSMAATNSFDSSSCYEWYHETWYPYYRPYYITYPYYVSDKDKFEKSFKIAKLLLKKRLLVSRKLKDFIALVEEIAKEL